MTSAAQTKPERDDAPVAASFGTSLVVKGHVLVSIAFLLVGLGLYGLAAAKLVWPDLAGDSALLTYGRVFPAGADALLYGWLTVGLMGVAMHALPRISGAPLASPLAALGALGLITAGTAWGTFAVLTGNNAGGRWLEYPLTADGALIAGAFVAAAVLTMTAMRGTAGRLPVAGWYLVAAPWWLVFSLGVGALPFFDGLPADVQAAFAGSSILGLWVVAAAIGGAYYVVSVVVPEARFHSRLGRIGFWSLAFAWAWTAGRTLQYGPTNDWFETLPILFGAGVVLAAVTITTDFVQALRGRWQALAESVSLRLLAGGVSLLVVAAVVGFLGSLRSVSAVVGLTSWEAGYEQIVILGVGTLLTMGALVHVQSGRTLGRKAGASIFALVLIGVVASAGSRLVAGLQQGFAWLAGVQSQAFDNFGDGFAESVRPVRGAGFVQVGGLVVIGLGAGLFSLVALRHVFGRPANAAPSFAEGGPVAAVPSVLRGAVALFVVAALGAFLFPAIDSDGDPSLLAEASHGSASSAIWDRGQELYLTEGCWYCHSREVRPIITDVGLGPISTPGDYAYDTTALVGVSRLGPDLAHFGSRNDGGAAAVIELLSGAPATALLMSGPVPREWSTMPSYRYLSESDLAALAAYVAGLE